MPVSKKMEILINQGKLGVPSGVTKHQSPKPMRRNNDGKIPRDVRSIKSWYDMFKRAGTVADVQRMTDHQLQLNE